MRYINSVFARDSIYAIARICYRPSVRPSHGWISQKRLKLASCNFHHDSTGWGKKSNPLPYFANF